MPVTSSTPSARALPAGDVFAHFLKLAEDDLFKPDCTITVNTNIPHLNWHIQCRQGFGSDSSR